MWRNLLVIALFGWMLHLLNLSYVFEYGRQTGADYTRGADSPVYRGMADAWTRGERLDPMYQERLLVPGMLRAIRAIGLGDGALPWFVSVLVVPTVLATGWLAWMLTARPWGAYLAAGMTALYPTAFQYGTLVETDTLHLYLAVMALTSTIAARKTRRREWLLATAVFWPLAHLARPALWGMAIALPMFLWGSLKDRATRAAAVLACMGALLVPASFAAANLARFGIASPSLHQAEILFVWTRSRVAAVVEAEESGREWTPAVRDAVAAARRDPRWPTLHGRFASGAEFAAAYRGVIGDAARFLREHARVFIRTSLGEFLHQCSAPLRFHHRYGDPPLDPLYPRIDGALRATLKLAWWFGLCGWAWVFGGRNRDVALLILFAAFLNFAPSSLSSWAGARIRMVSDVMGIPLIVAGVMQPMAWVGLCVVGAVGYLPRRFGASALYFNIVAVGSALAVMLTAAAPWKRTRKAGSGN